MAAPDPHDVGPELEFHLEMLTRRYMQAGLSREAAAAKARERLGDIDTARASAREISLQQEKTMTRTNRLSSVLGDVRFAGRMLRRSPLFTAAALLTIAIGTGAATAIFSVVHAVLMARLPYPAAESTLLVYNAYGNDGPSQAATSPEEFADLVARTHAFAQWAALRPQASAITDGCSAGAGCEPERVSAYVVSPNLFELLGVSPARGRGFTRADGVSGAARVVIISDGLWKRRFGADPGVIGRTVTVGAYARTVVGVMREGVRFPDEPVGYLKDKSDLWIPFNWDEIKDGRGNQYLVVVGSLKPGVSTAEAQADLQGVDAAFRREFPDRYAEPRVHWRLASVGLREAMVGDVRPALLALFGAVTFVLLIACANVANLMIAKGAARRRELAVRSALGADRRRLVQQLLIETVVLTSAGTALGVAVAAAALNVLVAINPGGIPRLDQAAIDGAVLAFASTTAIVTGLLVGLWPALRQSGSDPQDALSDGGRGAGSNAPRRGLRGALVAGEVTLAVIVSIGALLLVRSFAAISQAPTGVRLSGTMVAELAVPRATYDTPAKVAAFDAAIVQRLRGLPGVSRASAVYPLPMSGEAWSGSIGIVGLPLAPADPEPHCEYAVAMPGYFQTAGIRLVAGRDFTANDTPTAPGVAIVDTQFAERYWPGQPALGKLIATSGDTTKGPFQTIVGVVEHVRRGGPRDNGEAQLYLAATQSPQSTLYFIARAEGDVGALVGSIREAVRAEDPRLPVALLASGDTLMKKATARDRFNALLFAAFGLVALVLSAVGLYGILASLVAQRTREIGIRLALGGRPGTVMRGIVSEGMLLAGTGLVAGIAGARALSHLLESLLFNVTPGDIVTYVAVAVLMLGVTLAASIVPARRAMRIDPASTLKS